MLLTHERYPHSSVQPLGFDAELLASLIPDGCRVALAGAVGHHAYGFFLQTEDGSDDRNRVHEASASVLRRRYSIMTRHGFRPPWPSIVLWCVPGSSPC